MTTKANVAPKMAGQVSSAPTMGPPRSKINNGGLTDYVSIADPSHGKLLVLEDDPYLEPFQDDLKLRINETRK